MKAVILAGGFGTRISEETASKPKPMIEIGGMPILWHIMKIYESNGINDFIICLGYKGEEIKAYFQNYALRSSNIKVDLSKSTVEIINNQSENWKISLIDTGAHAMTGGRVKAISSFLDPGEAFCLTYGDGVGNVDIKNAIKFHKSHGKLATVTAVTPPGRFGVLDIIDNKVLGFREKIASDQYQVNAGFFVLEPRVLDFIADEQTSFEQEPMEALAKLDEMRAWVHNGFWMPMDTLRDKNHLNELWDNGKALWKVW